MSMLPVNETVVVPVVGRRMVWFGLSRVTRMAWLVSGSWAAREMTGRNFPVPARQRDLYIEPIMLMNTPSLRKLRSVRSSEKSVKL